VDLREFILENFAGDLEYHPRRAAIYFVLAIGAGGFWAFSPSEIRFTTVPLVFALGSFTLLGKGIFLLRPSSEGIGLSLTELAQLANSVKRKRLAEFPVQAAQIVQDFGTGGLLLWPLLRLGKDIDATWNRPPEMSVLCVGAVLFGIGWSFRRFMRRADAWSSRA
jgi:hypothetical protein